MRTKQQITDSAQNSIDCFARYALEASLRAERCPLARDFFLGKATAYNHAAAFIAFDLGIASLVEWRPRAAERKAA
jgi:hypothetical protein